ncbi:MAG TPA: hypothetical protein VKZ18_01855 [Polyangia bacterium]|nr:hypothetical protein [Polyangia bacterium]
MRMNVARVLPTQRRQLRAIDHDRRVSPVAVRGTRSARAGLQLGAGCAAFFVAYVTLNLLHALSVDPTFVVALAPIPLFARFLASVICAVPAGLALGLVARNRARWLRRLPALLAAAIALFVVTIALFA